MEVSESAIEAEDGCCPECGSIISASSSFLGEDPDEYEEEQSHDEDDVYEELDDDEDDIFERGEFTDDSFDDEDLDEEFDEDFDDDEAEDHN